MSVQIIDLASNKKKNENAQKRILRHQREPQKHFLFPKPGTSLLLSDKSEFPSLSESLGRASNYLPSSGAPLKYSDKLKLPVTSRNDVSMTDNMHLRHDTGITDTNQNTRISKSKQNIPKQVSDHSLNKSVSLSNNKSNTEKKGLTKQKPVIKSKLNAQNIGIKTSACNSNDVDVSSKSSNKTATVVSNELKEENSAMQDSTKEKKKKKRKSKIKRQVALQSGKITFLTPEVHSKILNQASTFNVQNSVRSSVIGNINDEEEYPELGKALLPVSQKENFFKVNISSEFQVEAANKSVVSSESNVISENIVKDIPVITVPGEVVVEKKEKNEKVHSNNPITISFYDMLLEKNIKQKKEVKELKISTESPNVIGLYKFKIKKNSNHPHNLLDSSSPAIKRGKEREKPKPKKPSQLKKIILLDRKARREQLLQMKNISEDDNVTNEDELVLKLNEEENNQTTAETEGESGNKFANDLQVLCEEDEENDEILLQLNESTEFCNKDELISEMVQLHISEDNSNYSTVSDLASSFEEVIENNNFVENSTLNLSLNDKSRSEADSTMASQINNQLNVVTEMHLRMPRSPESLLNSLTANVKSDISDKEKAVKILLHTRNFREYCNHLISKDIDDATYALLDDLARFQDRLHQKDPVKARMKKRMIYGVKEVKKHIRLRKLKCIIIAVDIENVETHGGLNDILNEIKASAVDHHILCIFALSRKVLGKVCRKPVPVSCVGVFNYEGSETNFKKLTELQSQSKADYVEIFNKLLVKVTDKDISTLIKAKKEAPGKLRDIRTNILSNFFLLPNAVKSEDENVDLKFEENMSLFIEIPT